MILAFIDWGPLRYGIQEIDFGTLWMNIQPVSKRVKMKRKIL
jgi:hypothetical protein